jgi:hypothetical protein
MGSDAGNTRSGAIPLGDAPATAAGVAVDRRSASAQRGRSRIGSARGRVAGPRSLKLRVTRWRASTGPAIDGRSTGSGGRPRSDGRILTVRHHGSDCSRPPRSSASGGGSRTRSTPSFSRDPLPRAAERVERPAVVPLLQGSRPAAAPSLRSLQSRSGLADSAGVAEPDHPDAVEDPLREPARERDRSLRAPAMTTPPWRDESGGSPRPPGSLAPP